MVGISILVLLFTVLSMMIQLIPIITPALFIILLFTNWYKYRFVYKPLRINGFWLSKNEKNKFMSVADYICTAQRNKDYVHAAVQNEGIRINQDGRISAKSYRGKDLRNVLDNANSTINEYIPTYRYLKHLPQNRWKATKRHFVRYKGFAYSIAIWAIFLLCSTGNITQGFKQYVSGIGETGKSGVSFVINMWKSALSSESSNDTITTTSKLHPDNTETSTNTPNVIDNPTQDFAGALWESLFLLLATYVTAILIFTIYFRLRYKKPPLVEVDNVFTYNVRYEKKPRSKSSPKQPKENSNKPTEKTTTLEAQQDSTPTSDGLQTTNANVLADQQSDMKLHHSKEEEQYNLWAKRLQEDGYTVLGNWENWDNVGEWKNLNIIVTIEGVEVSATIEYYTKGKQLYYGIRKSKETDQVSQTLLNSETFNKLITEFDMSVKNNEWWYCSKSVAFENAYGQYHNFINAITQKA